MSARTTAEKLAAIVALLKDGDVWRDDVNGADFIQDVTAIADAPTAPALRLYLYRVLENDDDGDPLDFGPVFALDLDAAKKLVKAHLLTLGSFGWEGGTLPVRFYDLGIATMAAGVPTNDDTPNVDVRIRATKKEAEASDK